MDENMTEGPEKGSKARDAADIGKSLAKGGVGGATSALAKKAAGNALEKNDAAANAVEAGTKAVVAAQKVLLASKALISFIVATIIDPIFWGVLAVIVLVVAVYSTSQVLGKNENANGCTGGGSGASAMLPSGGSGGKVDIVAQRNAIGTWLMTTQFKANGGKPFSKEQAAGWLGNWQQESTLNPAISQNGWCSNCNNEQILAIGGVDGRAVGLMQWDADRRIKLVQFAQGKGKQWSDLGVQLEYFQTELDGYEGKQLAQGNFSGQHTVDEYVNIINQYFERSKDWKLPNSKGYINRHKYAQEFMQTFQGGAGITTGGSCLMGGSFDASGVVQLAISISYPTFAEAEVRADPEGADIALPAYKAAKAAAEQKGGKDPLSNLYASCDRFVATVMKNTVDPDIPWGPTDAQSKYLQSSPKWQKYTKKSEARPGDIWCTVNNGHIIIYIGNHNGKDSIAEASHLDRVSGIGNASYLNENLVDTGGRQYYGYHFVG